jgi:hypothetical protein
MQAETNWLSAPKSTTGQDQFGCLVPCELAYSQHLPGITNVTDRARSFSFYPWVTWSLDRQYHVIVEAEYVESYRKGHRLFTLVAAQKSHIANNTGQAAEIIRRFNARRRTLMVEASRVVTRTTANLTAEVLQ